MTIGKIEEERHAIPFLYKADRSRYGKHKICCRSQDGKIIKAIKTQD